MSFSSQLDRFIRKASEQKEKAIRATKIELFSAVVDDTPVAEFPKGGGRLRGNWQATIGSPASGEISDRSAQEVISEIEANAGNSKLPAFLTNNLPYATVAEYGEYPDPPEKGTYIPGKGFEVLSVGGYSKQAPAGMVRRNAARFRRILRKQARIHKK